MLCQRYCSQKSQQRQPPPRPKNGVRYHAASLAKNEPKKSFFGVSKWKIPWIYYHIQKNSSWPWQNQGQQRYAASKDSLKELRDLQDRLAYIWRIITDLLGRCQPFTRLMRKDVSFIWDEAWQKVFEDSKEHLPKPPVQVALILRKLFLLYVRAMGHYLGALLVQKNDKRFKQAIYYFRDPWLRPKAATTQSRKSASLWSSQSRRHDIIWSVRPYMSFLELILCGSL